MEVARAYLLAGAATVAMTAFSVGTVAVTDPSPWPQHHSSWRPGGGDPGCDVPPLAGRRVMVQLQDRRTRADTMSLRVAPRTVPSGTVSLLALNRGGRAHELAVFPLSEGQRAGQRALRGDDRIDERGSLGEATPTCGLSTSDVIAAGASGWLTLTLRPGRYELLCNLPGHYRAGMSSVLEVK